MKRLRIIFGLLFIFMAAGIGSSQSVVHGTAIAAFRKPNEIVVAADSKEVNENGATVSDRVCKIRELDPSFFVTLFGDVRLSKTFDAFALVEKIWKTQASVEGRIKLVKAEVVTSYENALEGQRVAAPTKFSEQIHKEILGKLGIILFGLDGKTLFFSVTRFTIASDPGQKVKIGSDQHICPKDCPYKGTDAGIFVSASGQAEKYSQNMGSYLKKDLIAVARNFLESEIKGRNDVVGAPIDILQLSSNGPNWVQRKCTCRLPSNRK